MNIIKHNLLTETDGLIVHGTNCQSTMGSGIALAIRKKWPIVFEEYVKLGKGKHLLGTFQPVKITEELVIGNCFTQEYYGKGGGPYASLSAIESSLTDALNYAKLHNIDFKMPMIGCGLGGLEWKDVSAIVESLERSIEKEINVYYI